MSAESLYPMCEAVVMLGVVRFTCDRRIGHDGRHGGICPGTVAGGAQPKPVDVEVQWAA